MTKAEIIQIIHKRTGIPKVDVLVILETYFVEVKQTVIAGEDVSVRHFGTFATQFRNTKLGRNIRAKTEVHIPERYIPKFRPAKEFAVAVRKVKVK